MFVLMTFTVLSFAIMLFEGIFEQLELSCVPAAIVIKSDVDVFFNTIQLLPNQLLFPITIGPYPLFFVPNKSFH